MIRAPAQGLPYSLVDVFGLEPVSGNPLAVVHDADDLSAGQMQRIARYMNLSETVFLCRPTVAEADFAVRIFALDRELPWAGHPTLGACHAWIDAGGSRRTDRRIFEQCGAGLVTIYEEGEGLELVAPPLLRHEPPSDAELTQALRLLGSDGQGLIEAMWIDNGPGWLGLLFDRADTILALKPQRSWPAALHLGVVGFHVSGSEFAVEARAFHTDQHLTAVEDPVTGSFNAAVAHWLVGAGRLPGGYSVSQGRSIGRRGRIDVRTRDGAITISGRTRTVVRGTTFLV
jgi:PhzF family phenazine biosynthesis protein